jgi:hypothetical protein
MPGAQGGTYAAPVWHAFMYPASGDDCDDFPIPEEPAEFHPFFGKYASTGQSTTYYGDEGTATDDGTGGTSTDQDFDPRYYEEAPQNAPEVEVPPEGAPPADPQAPGGGTAPDGR